jgi:uncharacterized MAPEG superfamily protein
MRTTILLTIQIISWVTVSFNCLLALLVLLFSFHVCIHNAHFSKQDQRHYPEKTKKQETKEQKKRRTNKQTNKHEMFTSFLKHSKIHEKRGKIKKKSCLKEHTRIKHRKSAKDAQK